MPRSVDDDAWHGMMMTESHTRLYAHLHSLPLLLSLARNARTPCSPRESLAWEVSTISPGRPDALLNARAIRLHICCENEEDTFSVVQLEPESRSAVFKMGVVARNWLE
jgi:hypothetical protein